jgi:hypothetical protein
MNKICTDIRQSKKLIELGIDVKTADMHYMYRHWEIDENTIGSQSDASIGFDSDFYCGADNSKTYHYIPAWSLTALLKLIPTDDKKDEYYVTTESHSDYHTVNYRNCWDGCIHSEDSEESLLDAAFEMVCWLKENDKI